MAPTRTSGRQAWQTTLAGSPKVLALEFRCVQTQCFSYPAPQYLPDAPHKTETHCVCITVGGNRLEFPGETTTNCASLTTTKRLLKSTISTPGARFITLEIKNFYYNTPMRRYEYMKISLSILPEEIIAQYNLLQLAFNGWV